MKDNYHSHTTKVEIQGLTLANFASLILGRLKMLNGVFRQDPFLVSSFRNGLPLGASLDVSDMEQSRAAVSGELDALGWPPMGALLVYIAEPEFLPQTIATCHPSAVFSVVQDGDLFAVTAYVSLQVCPDRFFLQYALDSLTDPSSAALAQTVQPERLEGLEGSPDYFVERLRKNACEKPEAIAIYSDRSNVTYEALWSLTNRLASDLARRGGIKSDRMLILADRSPELIVFLVAALKSGIAFSLMDPKTPDDYIAECAQIVSPAFVVDMAGRKAPLDVPFKHEYTQLSIDQIEALPEDRDYATDVLRHDDLAAITFTSGTTGGPKAVMGRYGSLTYFFDWMSESFGPFSEYRFSMCSSLSHDPLQRDMMTPLYCGGSICIPRSEDIASLGRLQSWMAALAVNSICITPPLLGFLSEAGPQLPDLAVAFFVGAALNRQQVVKLRRIAPNVAS